MISVLPFHLFVQQTRPLRSDGVVMGKTPVARGYNRLTRILQSLDERPYPLVSTRKRPPHLPRVRQIRALSRKAELRCGCGKCPGREGGRQVAHQARLQRSGGNAGRSGHLWPQRHGGYDGCRGNGQKGRFLLISLQTATTEVLLLLRWHFLLLLLHRQRRRNSGRILLRSYRLLLCLLLLQRVVPRQAELPLPPVLRPAPIAAHVPPVLGFAVGGVDLWGYGTLGVEIAVEEVGEHRRG